MIKKDVYLHDINSCILGILLYFDEKKEAILLLL